MDNIIPNLINNTTIIGYETDGSTVRNPGVGLSTYQILPNVKNFSLVGNSQNTSIGGGTGTNLIMAGENSFIQLTDTTYNKWGKANKHDFYLFIPTGSTLRSISYTYIDSSGNEKTGTQAALATNTYYSLGNNVCINEFHINGTVTFDINNNPVITGNVQFDSTDNIQITLTNNPVSGGSSKIVSSIRNINYYYSGFFTCPNNAIAMVTSINAIESISNEYYNLNLWDKDGNRTILGIYYMFKTSENNMRTAGGGEYGCIGRIIKAGETIAFSCQTSSSQSRNVYANIKVVYF